MVKKYVIEVNEEQKVKGFSVHVDTERLGGSSYYLPVDKVEEVVYCKDCQKHNMGIDDCFEIVADSRRWLWKNNVCPLVAYRGKAQDHEFDYQYAVAVSGRSKPIEVHKKTSSD